MYFYEDYAEYEDSFLYRNFKSREFEDAKEALENLLINLYGKNLEIVAHKIDHNFEYLCELFGISNNIIDSEKLIQKKFIR